MSLSSSWWLNGDGVAGFLRGSCCSNGDCGFFSNDRGIIEESSGTGIGVCGIGYGGGGD